MDNDSITFKNAGACYDSGIVVLSGLNFSVPRGSYCAIVGKNGSGKSTLIKLIAGLMKQSSGKIVNKIKHISYLPQSGNFNRNFPISVADVLKMGRYVHPNGNYSNKVLNIALESVKLAIPLTCPISNLSGGQFQRVLFARILVQNPDMLLLDEPFNGIDEETIIDLAKVLNDLHLKGKTIIVAIHDRSYVNNFVPMIIDVKNGSATLQENANLMKIKEEAQQKHV